MIDGLLIIDKPVGPTSHDVVACVRRVLREQKIGHTGTLDPLASGVLPLVVGRATRLARFLSGADKVYDATIRLGFATDSGDSAGRPVGTTHTGPLPDAATIEPVLQEFRGSFLQQPPALSAKKIGGRRSYELARARNGGRPPGDSLAAAQGEMSGATTSDTSTTMPAPVTVTTYSLEITSFEDGLVAVRVHCSSGFYMRSLAAELGQRLGVGGHLASLRRIRSGEADERMALSLPDILNQAGGRERALAAMVPLDAMLPGFPAVRLSERGIRHVAAGRDLSRPDLEDASNTSTATAPGQIAMATAGPSLQDGWYRLTDSNGRLLGIGRRETGTGLLHPSVVLM